jgi:hypothetical protein
MKEIYYDICIVTVYLSVCLSACLPACLPSWLPVCLSVYLLFASLVNLDRLFSFLIYTQSVGLLGQGISPSQGRYINTEQHKQKKRTQTSTPRVRFEPTIPVFVRAKTVIALDRAAAVIGIVSIHPSIRPSIHPPSIHASIYFYLCCFHLEHRASLKHSFDGMGVCMRLFCVCVVLCR